MKRRYARGRYDDLTVFAFFGLDMLYEKPEKKFGRPREISALKGKGQTSKIAFVENRLFF